MPPLSTTLRLTVAAGVLASAGLSLASAPAQADIVTQIQNGAGAPYVVYLVKDLGGGAYYNITTGSLYVVTSGGDAAAQAAATSADLVATSSDQGRTLLLTINGAVLKKVEGQL
jgi:predicted nuclease with TOPRIM domain